MPSKKEIIWLSLWVALSMGAGLVAAPAAIVGSFVVCTSDAGVLLANMFTGVRE